MTIGSPSGSRIIARAWNPPLSETPPMRRQRSFRPTLTILENRWVPAVGAYPDPFRTMIADGYATQAATGTNPVVFLGDSITFNWGTVTRDGPGSSSFRANFAAPGRGQLRDRGRHDR